MKNSFLLAGPAAALAFWSSLAGFAASHGRGYSHATKAVSELGAIGAPQAFAFNLMGFVFPGALVIVLAAALWQAGHSRTGIMLLALSGGFLMLAGLAPIDMAERDSALSLAHFAGAMGSGLTWALALFWLGPSLARHGLIAWGRLSPWFGMFLIANVGWQVAWQAGGLVSPGWGQRIAFFGYFLWIAGTGWLLYRRQPAN